MGKTDMGDKIVQESFHQRNGRIAGYRKYLPDKSTFWARLGLREVLTRRFWLHVLCEFVAVTILLYIVIVTILPFPGQPNIYRTAAVVGCYVFALIESFGHVSWVNLNPVFGLALCVTGRISYTKAAVYLLADLAGAAAGTALALEAVPDDIGKQLASIRPPEGVTVGQVFISEIVITVAICLCFLGACDHWHRPVVMPSLVISCSVVGGVLVGGPISLGVINPALPFGIAVFTGDWEHQWMYWVSDYVAGVMGIILYHLFIYDGGDFILMEPLTWVKEKDANLKEIVIDGSAV